MLPKRDEAVEVTDPRAMRALAHPVRLAMLELLQANDTATATECAGVTGESPQACSYHLRTLAKWGFVRRAASADGRETRWENVPTLVRFHEDDRRQTESDAAARLLGSEVVARDERALAEFMARERELGPEWRDAQFVSATLHLSSAELRELEREFEELVSRHTKRREDRSPGSRAVRVVLRAYPLLRPKPERKGERSS
jgi:DNA-binding transcriptional ArsR family regulator